MVSSGRMEPSQRRPFEPAGAGGLLLGMLIAAIAVGLLIGWLAGSAGIGVTFVMADQAAEIAAIAGELRLREQFARAGFPAS